MTTTVVSHIGLPDREVTLLSNIFNVIGTAYKLNDEIIFNREEYQHQDNTSIDEHIVFAGKEQRRAPGRLADVIFIDGDSELALDTWAGLEKANPLSIPVFVTNDDQKFSPNKYCIKRPLVLKRIVSAMTSLTSIKSKKATASHNLCILVVDDSFPVRKYMEHTLPKLIGSEIKIEFAKSGEEAIEKMDKDIFDLVFLDVIMTGIDGYKTCKAIKAKHKSRVVMLTSKKSPFDKVRGTMSGCDAYITKPPKEAQLKKILEKCNGENQNFKQAVQMQQN